MQGVQSLAQLGSDEAQGIVVGPPERKPSPFRFLFFRPNKRVDRSTQKAARVPAPPSKAKRVPGSSPMDEQWTPRAPLASKKHSTARPENSAANLL
jgi:hypothetical protein